MARKPRDRAPEQIRYLLNRKGLTFADVDRMFGLKSGTARSTTRHPHLEGELAIGEALDLRPSQLWPSRFDPKTGARLKPQPACNYRDRPRLRTSQKREAA
jgi:lambda repressor-like predicted transcriptional regulator